MENTYSLDSIEKLITQGQLKIARGQLHSIKPEKMPGFDLVYYCSLLRRSGLSLKALQILQPLVYPKSRSAYIATPEEKLEYASNLVRLEIFSEADRILSSLDENRYPIVHIRRGFLLISAWDFESANICFQKYIQSPLAQPYDILIAKVNWLQGLVNLESFDEALKLAQELLKEMDPEKHKLLLAAVHEFCSEIYRLQNQFKKSFEYIQLAKTFLEDTQTLDGYLIRKQEALVQAYYEKSIDNLILSKQEALEKKHHESLRDLDLHIAILSKNASLLNQVYWGTQSPAYKTRIKRYAHRYKLKLDTEFYQFKKNKGIVYNLENQILSGTKAAFKKDQALGVLFKTLLSESYKPLKLIDLFSAVYPLEIFLTKYSTDKTHQLLKRLKQFLKVNLIPLEIICLNKTYRIKVLGNFSLSHRPSVLFPWEQDLLSEVRQTYFNVTEAHEVWGCSLRTTLRRIEILRTNSHLKAIGQTRSRRFQFQKA